MSEFTRSKPMTYAELLVIRMGCYKVMAGTQPIDDELYKVAEELLTWATACIDEKFEE